MSMSETVAVTPIEWENSIWFSDVDDTLISTEAANLPGAEGIRRVFAAHCGEDKAAEIQANYLDLYQLMLDGYRVHDDSHWQKIEGGKEAFDALVNEVASLQVQVQRDYGHIKKWSREIFIKLAADRAGVDVTQELVHEAADAYWMTLTENIEVFPDAIALSEEIANHGRPFFLATSSDGRLKMQADGQFVYDPEYSEALKRQRMECLRDRGLKFHTISIGDPEDKPHPDFFIKAIRLAEAELGRVILSDLSSAIMLGDSFAGDLQTPKERLGFGLVVLRQYGRDVMQVDDANQITVGNIHDSVKFLR